MKDSWLSIIEYSRKFNVSDMTVRRRIKNGKLFAQLKEGKYFIPHPSAHDEVPVESFHEEEEEKKLSPPPHHSFTREASSRPSMSSHSIQTKPEPQIPAQRMSFETKFSSEKIQHLEMLLSKKLGELENKFLFYFEDFKKCLSEEVNLLHKKIREKDVEVSKLNQNIRDLEWLVQFLEKK